MNFKVVAPPDDVDEAAPPDRMYSVWVLQLTWILEAGTGFPALSLSAVVFVCELSICMEIDQSPRFTRRVMSFQTVVLSRYGLEGPFCPPSALHRPCTDLVSLYPLKIKVTGVSSSGSRFFAHQSENCWSGRRWGHVDGVRPGGEVSSCRGFCSVPGPLQSVQRAEMWGVILALQSSGAVHLGVDNLGVVRHVGRLLDGHHGSVLCELVKDGELLLLIVRMLRLGGFGTVRVTKIEGHADESMVLDGRVREVDRLGNDAADEAADFGQRRVGNAVIDARRNLSAVCGRWYPVLLDLHRIFIAISGAVVNHDDRDGTAPDPLVWSAGAHPKRRRLVHAVRDRVFSPGPPGVKDSEWVNIPASAFCAEDITHWPYIPAVC